MKRSCDNCQTEYEADERNVKRGWGLCCSKSCAAKKREKAKLGYNPERVNKNNVRRLFWNGNPFAEKVQGRTSEGYRIIGGVAYDEFDEPVYTVDEYDDTHPFDVGDAGDKDR